MGLATDKQQLKAKMLAAGATQALRLFSRPLVEIAWGTENDKKTHRRKFKIILNYKSKMQVNGTYLSNIIVRKINDMKLLSAKMSAKIFNKVS